MGSRGGTGGELGTSMAKRREYPMLLCKLRGSSYIDYVQVLDWEIDVREEKAKNGETRVETN